MRGHRGGSPARSRESHSEKRRMPGGWTGEDHQDAVCPPGTCPGFWKMLTGGIEPPRGSLRMAVSEGATAVHQSQKSASAVLPE